jgi:hypothetical protein
MSATHVGTNAPQRRDASDPSNPQVRSALINAVALVLTALISAVGGFAGGWLQYRNTGSTATQVTATTASSTPTNGSQNHSTPARIITPREGDRAGPCPAVRGIAPSVPGITYWLAVQQIYAEVPYLAKQIIADPARPPEWDLGNIGIARTDQLDQDFYLMLIRTEGDATQLFTESVGKNVKAMPDAATVVDRVRVTKTAEPTCPAGR